jgi:uncharacterized protein YdcH (DUF465 family)
MFGEHHDDLTKEFPELGDRVQKLANSDPEFSRLYEEYREVDQEIYRIEQQIENPSDTYTEDLKKKRVHLKDQLYAMLRAD